MIRALFIATVVALSAVSVSLSREAQGDKSLEGTWLPSSAELAGQPFSEEILKTIKMVVKGQDYTVTVGASVDKGTFKVNESAKPKTIDISGTDGPNKGKTYLCIYERTGDNLKICYNLDEGKDRPTEFKTKEGTKQFLVNYKLEKK
jgi:uncharacterized protein (TIGR03067 family)